MGSTECFLKPVKDSLLRLIAGGSILIAYFKGGQISCISKSQSLWTRTWPWAFSHFICSTGHWIQLFILIYLPTGHKNDQDAGTSHAFVSWKTQPKMPRDDSTQMNPCCGRWGPLIGEGGGGDHRFFTSHSGVFTARRVSEHSSAFNFAPQGGSDLENKK